MTMPTSVATCSHAWSFLTVPSIWSQIKHCMTAFYIRVQDVSLPAVWTAKSTGVEAVDRGRPHEQLSVNISSNCDAVVKASVQSARLYAGMTATACSCVW